MPDNQPPEIKYNFSPYESADMLPVTAFEYQEQSHSIDDLKADLGSTWTFGNRLTLMKIIYPSSKVFKNNKSALKNSKFVKEAILDLLRSGLIRQSSEPPF